MSRQTLPSDERILMEAVLTVADQQSYHGKWHELEPVMARIWNRFRSPQCPAWPEVADSVRIACEGRGLLH